MDQLKLLSGHELVERGITKLNATLPEIGMKEVVPNGSWLEQKQVQSALETRKSLIEVERIEKSGVLSQAEWHEDLKLAEVTRMVGGYWQYVGHQIGGQLYLKPEEALFLMEVNSLQLTYNEVTMSLQQAYALLLRGEVSILQYKVYAYLCRVGYKVYRHEGIEGKKINLADCPNINISQDQNESVEDMNNDKMVVDDVKNSSHIEDNIKVSENLQKENVGQENEPKENVGKERDITESENIEMEVDNTCLSEKNCGLSENKAACDKSMENNCIDSNTNETEIEKEPVCKTNMDTDNENNITDIVITTATSTTTVTNAIATKSDTSDSDIQLVTTTSDVDINTEKQNSIKETNKDAENLTENCNSKTEIICAKSSGFSEDKVSDHAQTKPNKYDHYQYKKRLLENRKVKPLDVEKIEKCFDKVPDIFQKQIVTVNVPEEEFIPRNVFLNNVCYVLNLDNIRSNTKNTSSQSSNSRPYSANEDVNGDHVRRIKGVERNTPVTNQTPPFPNISFNRPFQNFWRPNFNFFPHNFLFQRPFIPHNVFLPRLRFFSPRPPLFGMYPRFNSFQQNEQRGVPNNKKRSRNYAKQTHLEAIKNLATRLKQLVQSGNLHQQENITSLQRLINTFNTKYNMCVRLTETFEITNEEIVVETITLEDEEPQLKKTKVGENDTYKINFNKLKQLACKLKELQSKMEVNSRHKRAFSNLIKRFNKSYNADVCLNSKGELIDRRLINLDSSSDSDCFVQEEPKSSSKKLKNPFNILKKLSEKNSNTDSTMAELKEINKNYSAVTIESFDKNWLPSEDDFGRAEIVTKHNMLSYLLDSKKDEYLYDFLHSQPYEYKNWIDVKLSFLKSIEPQKEIEDDNTTDSTDNFFLIDPNDNDLGTVIRKISIIKNDLTSDTESSLRIDFDVYNRDVQNFRKSNRPKPHFRVICLSDNSSFPSGKEIASLNLQYDNVPIVFAVVGVGSISFLQSNPFEIDSLIQDM